MKDLHTIKEEAKVKFNMFTWRVEMKAKEAVRWAEKNPQLALAVIPAVSVAISRVGKTIDKVDRRRELKKEEDLKNLYIYDHSIGQYHHLRKPLTTNQRLELEQRRNNGEKLGAILASMKVL